MRAKGERVVTEEEAYATCWSLIVNEQNLGPSCLEIATKMSDNGTSIAQDLVGLCVADVMVG